MKAIVDEHGPAVVSKRTKQAGDAAPDQWGWVERTVWTQRMLEALENGVKGGVWFSLVDKLYRRTTLDAAWKRVRQAGGAPGSDRQSLGEFEISRGKDHIRWTNKYFRDLGYFSLYDAHCALLQSS